MSARDNPSATPSPPRPGAALPRRRQELETTVADLLRGAAGKAELDRYVNLFEQGITSMHIVAAVTELERLLERNVQVIEFMRNPTIAAFAATLAAHDTAERKPPDLGERSGRGARRRALLQQQRSKTS
jgi:aryl carrier-like protein